ncbi:MAG: hypothetical protein KDB01_14250 [Planctomycetaceae bacterium]|nr:hypothetical protein [Planctomycetaceae bacterium]
MNQVKTKFSRLRALAFLLCVAGVYVITFLATLRRGHATYDVDLFKPRRGGFAYYWFSDDESLNHFFCKFYFPILRWHLHSRPYSSFENDADREQWCEAGNNIIMDDFAAVGLNR